MWTAPGYKPDRPTPPQEQGKRLATFPRGAAAELRVSLAEFEGRPYLALRVWERDQAGGWWPCKGKGCSIRLTEAAGLIGALQQALAGSGEGTTLQGTAPDRDDKPRFVDKGRPQRPPWDPAGLKPSRPSGSAEFDEFAG